jgi:hypothetical protein
MNENVTAYPLTWPTKFARAASRGASKFKTSLPSALKNVQSSLRLFGSDSGKRIEHLVISSNVTLGAHRPADPGVAVWFVWDGLQVCIPVDRYNTVEANLQAIHHIIEARRVELRHGTLALVRATFTGFLALAAPAREPWWKVLEVEPTAGRSAVEHQYKRLRGTHHPDRNNGEQSRFLAIQAAYEDFQTERGIV